MFFKLRLQVKMSLTQIAVKNFLLRIISNPKKITATLKRRFNHCCYTLFFSLILINLVKFFSCFIEKKMYEYFIWPKSIFIQLYISPISRSWVAQRHPETWLETSIVTYSLPVLTHQQSRETVWDLGHSWVLRSILH